MLDVPTGNEHPLQVETIIIRCIIFVAFLALGFISFFFTFTGQRNAHFDSGHGDCAT
jgi:hypothetical protein